MSERAQTFPMSDQQVWDTHFRHLADQGAMTNRQVAGWYAALEATAKERRERPPEPASRRRTGHQER